MTTVIVCSDGSKEIRHGNLPWRTNNPGDIKVLGPHPFAARHGMIGRDGAFAIFPSAMIGTEAMSALLQHNYGSYTVTNLVEKYAPPGENNTKAYEAALAKALPGIKDKKISDLTAAELKEVEEAIEQREGFNQPGTVQIVKPPPPPKQHAGSAAGGVNGCPYVTAQPTSCGSSLEVWQ